MDSKKIEQLIFQSGMFDEQWYITKYSIDINNFESPIEHFIKIGMNQNYDPSEKFNHDYYLSANPDVKTSSLKPFLHYLFYGIKEKRSTYSKLTEKIKIEEIGNYNFERSLDLGCGVLPRNPFNSKELYGVDLRVIENKNVKVADLNIEAIPFESNFFDSVTAFDYIEHVPRLIYTPKLRFSFVELMNEIYRVLKPGGLFYSHTPAYPSDLVMSDPTHVNIITEDTFSMYFDDKNRLASMYGFVGSFSIEYQNWSISRNHLITIMKKIS